MQGTPAVLMCAERLSDLFDHAETDSSLIALGGSPGKVRVAFCKSEVMHFWLAMPPMLHQVSSLHLCHALLHHRGTGGACVSVVRLCVSV